MSKEQIKKRVDDFLESFSPEARYNFTHGNCYWFALILEKRFRPWYDCTVIYNPILNHFCCKIADFDHNVCYADASGIIDIVKEEWYQWSYYQFFDPLDTARVYKDCIFHMKDEEWNNLSEYLRLNPWSMFQVSME